MKLFSTDKTREHLIPVSIVVITWLIFFLPILLGIRAYFLDDLKIIYYPIEVIYAQAQHSWQLPIWSNEFGFGQPIIAWGQLGFFTPLHLILRALYIPPIALLQISVAAYFLFGSIGMYLFLIRRKIHPAAATLGAVLFSYCGFHIGHLNHVNFYTSTMLLPWLLIVIDSILKKSSLSTATTLAIIAAAITVSGQPQIIFYTFCIAAIIGIALYTEHPRIKPLLWILYAGIVSFLLSSFALLPFKEFLPSTERGSSLPMQELFEFSYPPYDTITLIFPYFFGDHANYSGPKGFQELAAYVGIIPLMLAGVSLIRWKSHTREKIAGITLALIGGALSLGKYSAIYTYLVDQHIVTSIGVVGRFVFFFDIGILLLAAIGLHELYTATKVSIKQKIASIGASLLLPICLIGVPFGIYASYTPEAWRRFQELFSVHAVSFWIIVIGIIGVLTYIICKNITGKYAIVLPWVLPVLSSITLLLYGWNYNPTASASEAYAPSPFTTNLLQYREETGLPARLYSATHLPVTGNPHVEVFLSDKISPSFTVFQPLNIEKNNLRCLTIPIQSSIPDNTKMLITIRTGFTGKIWHAQTVSSEDAFKHTEQRICFPEIPESDRDDLMLSFSSNEETSMQVFVTANKSDSTRVYFVRVKNPNTDQLARSLKSLSVQYTPEFPIVSDVEASLMMRHIQAVAGSSSARWIGALSIKPYREFVDSFFANDSDPFDGDGIHALTRNKKLVDMVGITHFAQSLEYGQTNDPMLTAGYTLLNEADTGDSIIRLYKNPKAYPKAFMVPNAEFVAADDEVRFKLRDPNFDPKTLAYISGPIPPSTPPKTSLAGFSGSATIKTYTNTKVEVETTTNKESFLIVNDSTTPQWQTFIDGAPALQLKANSIFKAAQVPAGTHTVTFQYISPAIQQSELLTVIGILLSIGGYTYAPVARKIKQKLSK